MLGWLGAFLLLAYANTSEASLSRFYRIGICTLAIQFHWLPHGIKAFSHQDTVVVLLLFLLFVLIYALQFPVFLLLRRLLPRSLDRAGLRSPLAWIAIELLPVRLFPWSVGHTQSAFLPLCQIADLGGVFLIAFILLWCCEAAVIFALHGRRLPLLLSSSALLLSLLYGFIQLQRFSRSAERSIDVAIVQGASGRVPGIETESVGTLIQLTNQIEVLPDLVVWPEQALPFTTHESVYVKANDPRLPQLKAGITLLAGGLTHRNPNRTFNSMILIQADGRIPLPYHKRDLIPVGEYIPLVEQLPWLQFLNPSARGLSRGTTRTIFTVEMKADPTPARVAPLICYEDLSPLRAQEAIRAGAELLVVGSSDGWIRGWSEILLRQHAEMARFLAIETRRSLVRSTGTGVSAIYAPSGALVAEIPVYESGFIRSNVALLSVRTVYSHIADLLLPLSLLAPIVASICGKLMFNRK